MKLENFCKSIDCARYTICKEDNRPVKLMKNNICSWDELEDKNKICPFLNIEDKKRVEKYMKGKDLEFIYFLWIKELKLRL